MEAKVWTLVTAHFDRSPDDWAAYHHVFEQHGIPGTVLSDQPPSISGYAFEPSEADLTALQLQLKQLGAHQIAITLVPEEDWSETWRQFFVPRRIGERLMVYPTWHEIEVGSNDVGIVLDPGQAFGTGDHPTTRMCLELIERESLANKSVVDVGCGSGILSIAAVKLGAAEVCSSDLDPVSVISTHENMERNAVQFHVSEGAGFVPYPQDQRFDVVLSNIISAALIKLAPEVARRLNPGGTWIVSGIIESNWQDVFDAAERVGFILMDRLQENEWIAARLSR